MWLAEQGWGEEWSVPQRKSNALSTTRRRQPHPNHHHNSRITAMPGLQQDDEAKEEKLKAALWFSIGKMVDSVALSQDLNATSHFIGGLSELVWAQIENAAQDLEAFAKHADRRVINSKDVVLLGRRNDSLKKVLQDKAEQVSDSNAGR
jgi:centromere protein S